jgi:hypothetical protein
VNRYLAHRDEFPRLMAELGVESAVEVGSAECWFAGKLLQCTTLRKLTLVDVWHNQDHWRAARQFAAQDSRIELLRMTSMEAARMVKQTDFVYVDAMHGYADVHDDLVAWDALTTAIVAGHDYTMNPVPAPYDNGVILAVEEFYRGRDIYVTGAASPDYVERLRSAYVASTIKDLGPWNSHNPSWYVFKE